MTPVNAHRNKHGSPLLLATFRTCQLNSPFCLLFVDKLHSSLHLPACKANLWPPKTSATQMCLWHSDLAQGPSWPGLQMGCGDNNSTELQTMSLSSQLDAEETKAHKYVTTAWQLATTASQPSFPMSHILTTMNHACPVRRLSACPKL
jgi:hypothetical protein